MPVKRLLSLVLMPQAKELKSPTNACELSSEHSGPQQATANRNVFMRMKMQMYEALSS
jgi:hypothetical protein